MSKSILAIMAAILLTSTAVYARNNSDHDARDSWKWLQSISPSQSSMAKGNAVNDSGGGSSSAQESGQISGGPSTVVPEYDKGGRHN